MTHTLPLIPSDLAAGFVLVEPQPMPLSFGSPPGGFDDPIEIGDELVLLEDRLETMAQGYEVNTQYQHKRTVTTTTPVEVGGTWKWRVEFERKDTE